MAPSPDPVVNSFIMMQRDYYLQRKSQYDAQVRSYNEQIAQYKATMAKYQADAARYGDRAKISQEIENMRATLAAAQVGSRLNLLTATDQKLEIQRSLEFDQNAMVESQHQLEFHHRDSGCFYPAMVRSGQPRAGQSPRRSR